MSPLARPLLALAALLAAAAHRDKTLSYNTEDFGDILGTPLNLSSIHLAAPGGEIDVDIDACRREGLGQTCGVEVAAYNLIQSGAVPEILPVRPGQLTPIRVVCMEPDQCYPKGVYVERTLFCKAQCNYM